MSYFSEWQTRIEDSTDREQYQAFVQNYYELETEAYRRILGGYPATVSGAAADVAGQLGFDGDMVTFLGFLDGINETLRQALDLADIADGTAIALDIDFEKLYVKMHEAKADWLYGLEAWDNVLDAARRADLAKAWRQSKIAVSSKVGRNDPCPCGSGKKFKQCCGRA